MPRITFTIAKMDSHAYSDDNGKTWYWPENNSPCPLDACRTYSIPCDRAAQKIAYDAHLDAFLTAYRKAQPAVPSPERQAEMRAAFGPGQVVRDVVTGRTFRT